MEALSQPRNIRLFPFKAYWCFLVQASPTYVQYAVVNCQLFFCEIYSFIQLSEPHFLNEFSIIIIIIIEHCSIIIIEQYGILPVTIYISIEVL